MGKEYPLTVEPMRCDRDGIVRAIRLLLDEWNFKAEWRPEETINLPDIRNELKYAIFYLNNDGAIREQLLKQYGLAPKFTFEDNKIGMTIEQESRATVTKESFGE